MNILLITISIIACLVGIIAASPITGIAGFAGMLFVAGIAELEY